MTPTPFYAKVAARHVLYVPTQLPIVHNVIVLMDWLIIYRGISVQLLVLLINLDRLQVLSVLLAD